MRNINQWYSIISLILLSLIAAMPLHAMEPCRGLADTLSHGQIIWTQNAIVVQGTAVPNLSNPSKSINIIKRETQRAATLDAYRRAAELLTGVMITQETTGPDRNRVLATMQATVQQPQICKTKFYSDGGVDMVVMVPLQGDLITALLPSSGSDVAQAESPHSGLIVDATALPFRPTLAPRLLALDGSVLFSHKNIRRTVIKTRGVVQYVDRPESIARNRIGNRPFRTKAIQLGHASPSDLILDSRATSILRDQPTFLADANVVILTSAVQPIECINLFPDVVEPMIDWQRRLVVAKGYGKVDFAGTEDNALRLRMMERSAEVDARSNLLKALKVMTARSDGLSATSPADTLRFRGWVKNAVRCGAKYFRDGSAEVTLAAPLDGVFIDNSLHRNQRRAPEANARLNTTGVIIDTTGLEFKPVLAPMIVTSNQGVLYSSQHMATAYRQTYGTVAYHQSLMAAKTSSRIGPAPLIIKAVTTTPHPSHVVVAHQDALKIKALKEWPAIQHQGRVAIVTRQTLTHLSD